ncbi:MAG: hypothetical protein BWX88_05012 [Planctomycetes bacterium ADurb.Bin126]|nr:MAG: hypothetical protein BWX88_05012 [Planctomycetes bacterium ADurb.Bin126]HOD84294.1 hypothetical protein [Phycisphaerae bacterium]
MATFAQTMMAKYQTLLIENAGLTSVDIDGQKVAYADLERKYEHWRKRVLQEAGKHPAISRIRLDGYGR